MVNQVEIHPNKSEKEYMEKINEINKNEMLKTEEAEVYIR